MDPSFWGPGLWKAIHSMAATAETIEDRKYFKTMMENMSFVLPCSVCKNHLQTNMKLHPIDKYMTSNESLFLWTFLLHDAVNKAQDKLDDKRPDYQTVFNMYFKQNKSTNKEVNYSMDINDICEETCMGDKVEVGKINNTNTNKNKVNTTTPHRFKTRK